MRKLSKSTFYIAIMIIGFINVLTLLGFIMYGNTKAINSLIQNTKTSLFIGIAFFIAVAFDLLIIFHLRKKLANLLKNKYITLYEKYKNDLTNPRFNIDFLSDKQLLNSEDKEVQQIAHQMIYICLIFAFFPSVIFLSLWLIL